MTDDRPQYAIAGTYAEFLAWCNEDPKTRRRVTLLDMPERAKGRAPGVLHRIGTWQTSPARDAAERLEG